mgnify:CR=1 FL=1
MKKGAIDAAIDMAYRSEQNFKHGAVVVQNGKVCSSGHNKVTCKISHLYSCHAEMAAINRFSDKTKTLTDAHMYVVRINKCGLADSKPCKKCMSYMKAHGISRVFFSTGTDTFGSLYV